MLKNGEDQFSYYLLQNRALSDAYTLFLIYESFETEPYVCLVNYDTNATPTDKQYRIDILSNGIFKK